MLGLLETDPMDIGAYDELPWKHTGKDQLKLTLGAQQLRKLALVKKQTN